jgi:recombinational DNA repair protein RecR
MENHKHCQNCGNMIAPSETLCPICKLATKSRHDLPLPKTEEQRKAMEDLANAIEKWIEHKSREEA